MIASGRARALKAGPGGRELPLTILRAGDSFGEMGLLDGAKRTATVRASSDVSLLKMDGAVFQALLRSYPEIRTFFGLQTQHRDVANFFRVYAPFAKLEPRSLSLLVAELEQVEVPAGTRVVTQGEPADAMYIVKEGRLQAFRDAEGRRQNLVFPAQGRLLRRGRPLPRGGAGGHRGVGLRGQAAAALTRGLRARGRRRSGFPPRHRGARRPIRLSREARVPLDFAQELLPAEAAATEQVRVPEAPDTAEADRGGPFADEEGHFLKKPVRRRGFPTCGRSTRWTAARPAWP